MPNSQDTSPQYLDKPSVPINEEIHPFVERVQNGPSNPVGNGVQDGTSNPVAKDEMASLATGRLTKNLDALLAMRGILDGDPMGMEAFDLGYYENGTPALFINGSPIPIRPSELTYLLTARQKSRADMQARVDHEIKKQKTVRAIHALRAGAPNMNQQYLATAEALADIDPDEVAKSLLNAGVNQAKDNLRGSTVKNVQSLIQARNRSLAASHTRKITVKVHNPLMGDDTRFDEDQQIQVLQAAESNAVKNNDLQMSGALSWPSIVSFYWPQPDDVTENGYVQGFMDKMVSQNNPSNAATTIFNMGLYLSNKDIWGDQAINFNRRANTFDEISNAFNLIDQRASALGWGQSHPQATALAVQQFMRDRNLGVPSDASQPNVPTGSAPEPVSTIQSALNAWQNSQTGGSAK